MRLVRSKQVENVYPRAFIRFFYRDGRNDSWLTIFLQTILAKGTYTVNLRQRDNSLVLVIVSWWDVDKHKSFGITTKRILHQHGQLVVSVGDELLFTAQGRDYITKSWQRFVDRHSFLRERKVDIYWMIIQAHKETDGK